MIQVKHLETSLLISFQGYHCESDIAIFVWKITWNDARLLKAKGCLKGEGGGSNPTVMNIFQGSRVPIPSQKKMAWTILHGSLGPATFPTILVQKTHWNYIWLEKARYKYIYIRIFHLFIRISYHRYSVCLFVLDFRS